ncbi:MAG: ATP-binding protein [Coriobacteriia bacterium]|nr:ATP-binding protein [Coriobacteriia bacterium]
MTEQEPSIALAPAVQRGHGTFSRRLAIAFAAVAALTALLAAVLISASWNVEFDRYLRDNLQRVADGVAQVAVEAYPLYGGWTIQTLSTIPRFGPMRGIAVQILDDAGNLIYDDTTSVGQEQTGQDQQQTVLQPEGPVVTAPIVVEGQQVGSVRVWAFGPGAVLTERDAQFRDASVRALGIAALVAIALASIAGLGYASRLVQPIERITATARALRQGDRAARTNMTGEDEIAVLGRTIDEMAAAIEADRELEQRLTADVAHELRTPLQAIQATVEAMQDGVLPADEERLGIVRDETVRLGRLADAILELTRLERGSLPFDLRRIDLAEPLSVAVEMHEALFEASELELSASVPHGFAVVGDADRLRQAFSNLLSNAARYTPAGGSVAVRLKRNAGFALVEVEDTGIGISEEDMSHLFSRFWRADDARARSTGGLGIGLAVTKEIAERHKGAILAEPRSGGGTRFTIRIPLA